MIILYNPSNFELIFSVASILSEYPNEQCLVIPIKIKELLKENSDVPSFNEILVDQEKILLLGLHPNNKEENLIVIDFFDHYRNSIYLWIDNHTWPPGILTYLEGENKKIFVSPDFSCLQILDILNYPVLKTWEKGERAMMNIDLRDKLAFRYIQAMLVNKSIGKNYNQQEYYEFSLFMSIIDEILSGKENSVISELQDSFLDMIAKTNQAKKKLSDNHPIFQQAKKRGRPVGCLMLKEIDNYLNISHLLNYGTKKFPWLCVLGFTLEGNRHIYAKSKKVLIKEILSSYENIKLDDNTILQIMNAEIVNFPKRVKAKK
jgi:hypothetical protein